MKRYVSIVAVLLLGLTVLPSGLYAKDHRIELPTKATINGTELEPGKYRLRLNGDATAEFFEGKELVARAKFEIEPIGTATPNSVSTSKDGTLLEIRLSKERVVLVES